MRRRLNDKPDSGGGGGYNIPQYRHKSNDQEALDYLGAGFGAAGAAATAAMAMSPRRTNEDRLEAAETAKREFDAEIKRESRGIKKPANFDAMEESKRDAQDARDRKKISGMGYKSGGKVSSASSRADGCATKGKTRGKFV
jgi:hypothetical protein